MRSKDHAPESIKEEFRFYACEAIALHTQLQQQKADAAVGSMPASMSAAA